MMGRLAAGVHGSHIDDRTSTITITQTAGSQGNHLVSVFHYLIFYKILD